MANGVVYVGSQDGNVYALNASTGAKLWSYAAGDDVFLARGGEWGGLYRLRQSGNVYALNASTGAQLWSYDTGDFVIPRPQWRMGWSISALTMETYMR